MAQSENKPPTEARPSNPIGRLLRTPTRLANIAAPNNRRMEPYRRPLREMQLPTPRRLNFDNVEDTPPPINNVNIVAPNLAPPASPATPVPLHQNIEVNVDNGAQAPLQQNQPPQDFGGNPPIYQNIGGDGFGNNAAQAPLQQNQPPQDFGGNPPIYQNIGGDGFGNNGGHFIPPPPPPPQYFGGNYQYQWGAPDMCPYRHITIAECVENEVQHLLGLTRILRNGRF